MRQQLNCKVVQIQFFREMYFGRHLYPPKSTPGQSVRKARKPSYYYWVLNVCGPIFNLFWRRQLMSKLQNGGNLRFGFGFKEYPSSFVKHMWSKSIKWQETPFHKEKYLLNLEKAILRGVTCSQESHMNHQGSQSTHPLFVNFHKSNENCFSPNDNM